ncbi:unnamed protein product [Peronospora belbahrii]|nr:unnamed protein product [Peronospora belbahrii]
MEFHIRAKKKQSAKLVQSQQIRLQTDNFKAPGAFMTILPRDVLYELLLFLSPKDLATCPLVCKDWNHDVGDSAEMLWRHVFQRDFSEAGDRFAMVFPIHCWRFFYFRHHLSRAVELSRLFEITDGRKCVVIKGQVYDVTDFLKLHPGGPHVLGDAVGTDATVIWEQFQHSNEAKESMQQFLVWDTVLARPESEKLHGNLKSVMIQWQKMSWTLTHSHCFGRMAPRFANALFRFHSRYVTSKKAKCLHE